MASFSLDEFQFYSLFSFLFCAFWLCWLLLSHQVWHDICIDTFFSSSFLLFKILNEKSVLPFYPDFIFHKVKLSRVNNAIWMHSANAASQFLVITSSVWSVNTVLFWDFVVRLQQFNGVTQKRKKLKLIVHGAVW